MQKNPGDALLTQGQRTGEKTGPALLAQAVAAYRSALYAMAAQWTMTQENIVICLLARSVIDPEEASQASLAKARECVLAALRVFTPKYMSYNHDKTASLLNRIEAKLADPK